MRTSVESIHAIGDVVGGYLLAHAASHEGIVAAEDIAGERLAPMEQNLVTRCTYSHPQIASVGLTEKQAREKGHEVKIGKFPFTALGRAHHPRRDRRLRQDRRRREDAARCSARTSSGPAPPSSSPSPR